MEFFFFFQKKKEFLNFYTMILLSFPLGRCFDEVLNNRRNHQGYEYVYFVWYHTLTIIHFRMMKDFVRLSEECINLLKPQLMM